jgi:zinc metalloprotease ZmpB
MNGRQLWNLRVRYLVLGIIATTLIATAVFYWYFGLGPTTTMLLEMVPGNRADVTLSAQEQIEVTVRQDGIVVGGMNYYVDPTLRPAAEKCAGIAANLVKCLEIPDRKVKRARVRKIVIDVEMEDDCWCD